MYFLFRYSSFLSNCKGHMLFRRIEHRLHFGTRVVGLNFLYISQAKLSTVGKRDGGVEARVGGHEAAVGGRP